jgi:predicted 2-oxoglutarate/Fe(II)-dependent dioxygenase YbiX
MFDKFLTVKEFLTEEECLSILEKAKNSLELIPAEVVGGMVLKTRKSSVAFVNQIDEVGEKLKTFLENTITLKGFTVTGLGPYQFTEYKEGEYYNWHTDSGTEEYKDRFCSIVIQLNNDYTDGFLELKDGQNNTIQVERGVGNMSIFYSNILHRVTPVKDGIRYSLVNWVSLEAIKNNKKTLI